MNSKPGASVTIGGTTVRVDRLHTTAEGRGQWCWAVDLYPGTERLPYGTDLSSGASGVGDTPEEMLATLLSFLSAAGEAYAYEMRGGESENSDLFPPDVTEWAYQNSDELAMTLCELEES